MTETKIIKEINIDKESVITWKEYTALVQLAATAKRYADSDCKYYKEASMITLKKELEKLDKLEDKIFKI